MTAKAKVESTIQVKYSGEWSAVAVREANRALARDFLAGPGAALFLDGRGRREGPAWRRFEVEVAALLEISNACAVPTDLDEDDLSRLVGNVWEAGCG